LQLYKHNVVMYKMYTVELEANEKEILLFFLHRKQSIDIHSVRELLADVDFTCMRHKIGSEIK
jgi:hypothetical protein